MFPASSLAAECTDEDFTSFEKTFSQQGFLDNCGGVLAASSVTAVDIHSLSNLDPCGDDKCVAYLKVISVGTPQCELQGLSLPQVFEMLYSFCSLKPTKLPTSKPTNSTKAPLLATPTLTPTPMSTPAAVSLGDLNSSLSDNESESAAPTTRPPPLFSTPATTTARPRVSSEALASKTVTTGVAVVALLVTTLL